MRKLIVPLSIRCFQGTDLRADLGQAGKQVSPNLSRLFLEEINHAGDGFFDTATPPHSVKARSVPLEIASARGAAGLDDPVTVSLEGKDGVYEQAQSTGLEPSWSRCTAAIQSTGADPAACLVISATGSGIFWINVVSMRPGKDILFCEQPDAVPMFVAYAGMKWTPGTRSPFGALRCRTRHTDSRTWGSATKTAALSGLGFGDGRKKGFEEKIMKTRQFSVWDHLRHRLSSRSTGAVSQRRRESYSLNRNGCLLGLPKMRKGDSE